MTVPCVRGDAGPEGLRYAAEEADPYTIDADEAVEALAGGAWRRFAVIGDSLAQGVGDPSPGYRDVPWADRVAETLRASQPRLAYLNTGQRGARVSEVIERQLESVLDFRPDLGAVVCGGNDMLAPDFSADGLASRLAALFRPLRDTGADLFTYTLQDVTAAYPELAASDLRTKLADLNEVVRWTAAEHGASVVELWGHPSQSAKDVYSADLMHASGRGHAIVAAITVQHLAGAFRAGTADARGQTAPGIPPAGIPSLTAP